MPERLAGYSTVSFKAPDIDLRESLRVKPCTKYW